MKQENKKDVIGLAVILLLFVLLRLPTLYEPFGLVLIEAAAMGMNIVTTRNCVGASELLENLEGIEI